MLFVIVVILAPSFFFDIRCLPMLVPKKIAIVVILV
ncbi:MAG: hypothetical protein H6R18_2330 [Proteobacteria bacterium]|nr:hypothetical protein [Pseudomonadota bacterium]